MSIPTPITFHVNQMVRIRENVECFGGMELCVQQVYEDAVTVLMPNVELNIYVPTLFYLFEIDCLPGTVT